MNILLTGGTGLVGSYLVKQFFHQGHHVSIFYRGKEGMEIPPGTWPIGIRWIRGDLHSLDDVREAMRGQDAVVHVAGMVSFSPKDKKSLARTNVDATRLWVDLAIEANMKRFVFLSSVAALGKPKSKKVLDENTQWETGAPLSEYAKTKHLAEREVWRGIEEGLPAFIIAPSVVLGPSPVVRSSLKLLDFGRKDAKWSFPGLVNYVDVRDIADFISIAWEEEVRGEKYILSAGHISYTNFLSYCASLNGQLGPKRELSLPLLRFVALVETWRTCLLGGQPKVTLDMVNALQFPVSYNTNKSTSLTGFTYRGLEESLEWVMREQWEVKTK